MGWADPHGVSTPSGFSQAGIDTRIAPHAAPVAFASLQRSIAAPPHRPGEPFGSRASDDASFPGLSRPTTHAGRGTRTRRASSPASCRVRGLVTSCAASTPDPPRDLAASRASTGFHLRGVLLAPVRSALADRCRPAVLRVGSPRPLGACGRVRLHGLAPGVELVLPRDPCGARGVDASMVFLPPERSPPPSLRAPSVRARSLRARWAGLTSRSACASRCRGTAGSACPSRDCRLSWDSSPCDRRGTAWEREEGGLMGSPHGGGRCTRPAADPSPLVTRPTAPLRARPGAAVHR
jgi:hypothetical protein